MLMLALIRCNGSRESRGYCYRYRRLRLRGSLPLRHVCLADPTRPDPTRLAPGITVVPKGAWIRTREAKSAPIDGRSLELIARLRQPFNYARDQPRRGAQANPEDAKPLYLRLLIVRLPLKNPIFGARCLWPDH